MKITVKFPDVSEPVRKYDGWRVLHKHEGGYDRNPDGMPSVIPPIPSNRVDMTEDIQKLSWELMHTMNPTITERVWNRCHSWDRAFNNNIGFPNANGGTPRRDYINDTDRNAPLPGYDKAQRLCGGLFVRGETSYSFIEAVKVGASLLAEMITRPKETIIAVSSMGVTGYAKSVTEFLGSDNMLTLTAGKHGIDGNSPLPDVQTIIDNNWIVYGLNVGKAGNENGASHWAQGMGGVVVFPLIFTGQIQFPLSYFERWQSDRLPDVLKIGG